MTSGSSPNPRSQPWSDCLPASSGRAMLERTMHYQRCFLIYAGLLLALLAAVPQSLADKSLLSPQELAQALASQPQVSVFLPAAGLRAGTNVHRGRRRGQPRYGQCPADHSGPPHPPRRQVSAPRRATYPSRRRAALAGQSRPPARHPPGAPQPPTGAPLTIPSLADGLFEVAIPGTLLHEGDYWIQAIMLVGEEDIAHSTPALVPCRSAPPATQPAP